MKKMIMMMALAIATALAMQSCEKKDVAIDSTRLPEAAQSFVVTYFPQATIQRVVKDYDDGTHTYKVILSDGTFIEFNSGGEWRDIENSVTGVPEAIIPDSILDYIATNYTNSFVVGIEFRKLYVVELNSDLELIFSKNGEFMRVDM